jgi:hypothetical protein
MAFSHLGDQEPAMLDHPFGRLAAAASRALLSRKGSLLGLPPEN